MKLKDEQEYKAAIMAVNLYEGILRGGIRGLITMIDEDMIPMFSRDVSKSVDYPNESVVKLIVGELERAKPTLNKVVSNVIRQRQLQDLHTHLIKEEELAPKEIDDLISALDLFIRVGLGRIRDLSETLRFESTLSEGDLTTLENRFTYIKQLLGFPTRGARGIFHPHNRPIIRTAHNLLRRLER